MRYRVTFANNNGYEAVIFRDFEQHEGRRDDQMTSVQKQLDPIVVLYGKLGDQLRGQTAFTVKRIEEVPSD